MGEDIIINKKLVLSFLAGFVYVVVKHCHAFRRRGCLIQQGCIGNFQTGKVAYHGLKIQQAFQPALCNFCLVGRVLGVPAGIFKHIAQNNAWRNGIIIALANVCFAYLVFCGYLF